MAAKKNKRSIAAKKGWDTRRENARLAAEESERRSKASKKAWAKRKKEARELEREIDGFLEREILPEANPRIRKTPKKKAPKKAPKKPRKPRKPRKPELSQEVIDLQRWVQDLTTRLEWQEKVLEDFPETRGWLPMFPNRVKRDGTLALEDVGPLPGSDVPLRQLPPAILDPILRRAREAMESEIPIAAMKWLAEQMEIDVRELYALVFSG